MADYKIKNVEITRRETIKPSSPTPQHLRITKLSLLDQLCPDVFVSPILFYPFNDHCPQNPAEIASKRLKHLRETLSKTLTRFYPFAGRLRNNLFIECSDDGAEFVEAKALFSMTEILRKPDFNVLPKFVAESTLESTEGCLLLVQATIFDCGGIALGLSFNHKIADACTFSGFIRSWAKTAQDSPELVAPPEFSKACDLFPPMRDTSLSPSVDLTTDSKLVRRRYVFSAEKIAALKSKASSHDSLGNPTRVEAISGLLWKCATRGSTRASIWGQAMNLRKRIVPPFGDNTVGNIAFFAPMAKKEDHEAADLKVLVQRFREGIEEAKTELIKNESILGYVQGQFKEWGYLMKSNAFELYIGTSWSRFGFYEADFGWEKPTWVSLGSDNCENSVVLIDTKDGDGIEALLMLREQGVASIESAGELLAFASFNPSVV